MSIKYNIQNVCVSERERRDKEKVRHREDVVPIIFKEVDAFNRGWRNMEEREGLADDVTKVFR